MGSSKKVVVGYRYRMGLHFVLCRTLDRLDEIIVGERSAWRGPVSSNTFTGIEAWDLFGGDKREGGIEGVADILFGDAAQTQNAYLVSKLGSLIPAFRGVVSVIFRAGRVSANTPYVKPWWFRCSRIYAQADGSDQWYEEKAAVTELEATTSEKPFELRWWQSSWHPEEWDYAGMGVQFLDLDNAVIGSSDSTISGVPDHEWTQRTLTGTVPAGTAKIRVWMKMDRISGGNNDGFIDNIALEVDNDLQEIVNPGAESGLTGWTNSGDGIGVRTADPDPFDGSAYFSGSTSAEARAYQDVSITTDRGGMNPAHIIRECLTDPYMRMNYPTSMIDDDSFTAAADIFYEEGMGLCFFWSNQVPVKDFIQTVLDHCGAVYYADPFTGKFMLTPIRGDYDPETLEVFDESSIINVESFERAGAGEIVNEISVRYFDVVAGRDAVITVQDLASVYGQGDVIAETREYPGIPNPTLAARVAQRDLTASTAALARIKVRFTRKAATLRPGGVIKFSWAKLGLSELICRVMDVSYGGLNNGEIRAELAEDVFGLPENSYQGEQPTGWDEPDVTPQPVADQHILEGTYWDVVREASPADFAALSDTSGFVYTLAEGANAMQYSYGIWSRIDPADFELAQEGMSFAPKSQLTADVARDDTTITIDEDGTGELGLNIAVGDRLLLPGGSTEEQMEVTDLTNLATGVIGVNRGVLDTTPQIIASGTDVWLLEYDEEDFGRDAVERFDGDTVDYKLLSAAGGGDSSIDDATEMSLTYASRIFRPYPPGKIRINGEAFPAGDVVPGFIVSWAHRDREQQTASFISQEEDSIGPEAGTTYNLYFYDDDTDTLKHTELNVDDDEFSMPDVAGTFNARLEIAAERDGVESWERQIREFSYSGAFPIRGAVLTRSTSVSLTVSANTAIDWDTEVADFGGYWSSGAEVTVPSDSAGWHLLTTNLVKDLGTAWYSAGNLTQGASSATWPSGNYASLYEGIIGGTYDEHHSNAFCANIPAGGTARQLVNWFTGGGSRTVEAGAKFGIAKIWAAPSRGAAVRRISDVSISNATDTTAGFSTEDLDQGGYFDSGTSTTRLTVPTGETGWYVITAHNRWDLTSTGATLRKIMLRKNGAGPWLGARQVCLTGGGLNAGHSTPVVAIAYLAATDYVEMRIRHTHGSALDSKYVAMSLAKADVASTVGARVSYAGSAQTVNSGSTAISFDTEENDDDGMVDLGTNATRITATVDGLYAIAGHVGFAANTGTTRQAILRVDGTTEIAKDGSRSDAAGTNTPILNPGAVYYLTAGQYVELVAITGTNTTTATGDDRPQLAMLLLGEDA